MFMPPKDEVLPAEDQPPPACLSHLLLSSLGYSSDDDKDEDIDIEGDEEEEEHPAPADSTAVALPAVFHVPTTEELSHDPTTLFSPDTEVGQTPCITYSTTITTFPWSTPLPSDYLLPTTPILIPLPCIISTPLFLLSIGKSESCYDPAESRGPIYFPFITAIYHTLPHQSRYTSIRDTTTLTHIATYFFTIFAADHGASRPEVYLPPRKRLYFAFGPRYEVRESSSVAAARSTGGFMADYGFVATMDMEIRRYLERDARHRRDLYEVDDEQIEQKLMDGRLNMLYRDRRVHARITILMEREAMMSREAWGRSMNTSDLARLEVMSLRTTVLGQQAVIIEL
ncbi:hypothetical protein Tco_0464940 [Tanacetum coccineum]